MTNTVLGIADTGLVLPVVLSLLEAHEQSSCVGAILAEDICHQLGLGLLPFGTLGTYCNQWLSAGCLTCC